jgi:hypothetical protein
MCTTLIELWRALDSGERGLGHSNVLLDRTRTGTDSTYDTASDTDRQTTAEDHDLAVVALLNAE